MLLEKLKWKLLLLIHQLSITKVGFSFTTQLTLGLEK